MPLPSWWTEPPPPPRYKGPAPSEISTPLGTRAVLSPELVRLKEFAKVPTSLLSEMDSRTLAEALVQRLHLREEKGPELKGTPYDFKKQAQILIQFNSKNLDQIIEKGFLNYHETLATSVSPDQDYRTYNENEMIRLTIPGGTEPEIRDEDELREKQKLKTKAERKFDHLRPKYGYVDLTENIPFGKTKFYNEYGNVFAVMKDEVKLRTTWTLGDSIELTDQLNKKDGMVRTFLSNTLFEAEKDMHGRYLEAQIWGELDFRDIKALYVESHHQDLIDELKKVGLPVYLVRRVRVKGRQSLVQEETLYQGNRSKIKEYQKSLVSTRINRTALPLLCPKIFLN
ncbi:MAG: hypothetical protein BroJett040_20390 [Oligoflexia bacterium]|nr:MAG: hypothetical protein BroJett040_20390 [Oligoflexia bacterium]